MERKVYIRNILKSAYEKKLQVLIIILVTALLLAVLGFFTANSAQKEYEAKKAEYDEVIEGYETDRATYEENLATSQEQLAKYEEYVANSIYQNIDPQRVCYTQVQYIIRDCPEVGLVQTAIVQYVADGSLKESISENLAVASEYLREIITCEAPSNMIKITVIAPDMESSDEIMRAVRNELEKNARTLSENSAAFRLEMFDMARDVRVNTSILSSQNDYSNAIKNAKNSVQDYKDRIVNIDTKIADYSEENMPAPVNTPAMAAIKWGILGIIAGVFIAFVFLSASYVYGDRVRSREDLLSGKMPVIYFEAPGKASDDRSERAAREISLMLKRLGKSSLSFLYSYEERGEDFVPLMNRLKELGIECRVRGLDEEIASESEAVLLAVKCGVSTYQDIENVKMRAKNCGIELIGSVVVE